MKRSFPICPDIRMRQRRQVVTRKTGNLFHVPTRRSSVGPARSAESVLTIEKIADYCTVIIKTELSPTTDLKTYKLSVSNVMLDNRDTGAIRQTMKNENCWADYEKTRGFGCKVQKRD